LNIGINHGIEAWVLGCTRRAGSVGKLLNQYTALVLSRNCQGAQKDENQDG
jgi:hypothetical protein